MTNTYLLGLEQRLLDIDSDLTTTLDPEAQMAYIRSKCSSLVTPIISDAELHGRIERSRRDGQPLRVKFGIDPTGPDIHLGHAVPLLNLRRYLRLGCVIEFVVGDFTALIGDPSGRLEDRPPLSEEQIADNMRSYREQARRVVDVDSDRVRWHFNRSWMSKLDVVQWQRLTSRLPASALVQREDFRTRLAAGHSLSLAELEYAVYMAYDSVVLEPDIEVGGIDQLLNMQVCRRLMQASGQAPEVIVTYDLLPGTSGERDAEGRLVKMSKSRGNFIAVTAPPSEMFGATMSIPDETMWAWFRNLTEITPDDLGQLRERTASGEVHPKAAKELLARVVVSTFHSDRPSAALDAERSFSAKYGHHTGPVPTDDALDVPVQDGESLRTALVRASGRSSSDLRRVASQSGLKLSPSGGGNVVVVSVGDLDRPAAAFANSLIRVGRHLLIRLQVQR